MASTDPEIKDGFNLSAWIKSRPNRDYEPFATSPPGPEDSFFFIRYPKTDNVYPKQIPESSTDQSKLFSPTNFPTTLGDKKWTNHTKPCQDVLHGVEPVSMVNSITSKPKPAGTDDGFKGDGAACGSSIVKVAHQLVLSTPSSSQRGFTVASPDDDHDYAEMPSRSKYNLNMRRGSKSLPTTPVHSPPSSPTSRRKNQGNRYFTAPFEQADDATHRSWLSMALLGFKKDLAASTSTLAEEDAIEARLQGSSLMDSVENLGPSPRAMERKVLNETPTQQPKLVKPANTFRPKPSEFREMNFWSPTSM